MSLISAGSISLDSTFKKFRKECITSISQGATVFVVAFPSADYRPCSAFDKNAMKFHLPPSHLVSKLPIKKQGGAQTLQMILTGFGTDRFFLKPPRRTHL
jgi:hypothetical protein